MTDLFLKYLRSLALIAEGKIKRILISASTETGRITSSGLTSLLYSVLMQERSNLVYYPSCFSETEGFLYLLQY